MQRTVAILYGAVEGPRHTKLFRRTLAKAGYQVVANARQADVVVAHSGGCMLAPIDGRQQATLFINPTYWPGNTPRKQAARKVAADFRHYFHRGGLHFFVKHLWNWWYFFTDWPHSRQLLRAAQQCNMPNTIPIPASRVIVVRNEHDPWLTNDLQPLVQAHPNIRIVRLPGEHDDCWLHPEPYVNLLQSEDNEHSA